MPRKKSATISSLLTAFDTVENLRGPLFRLLALDDKVQLMIRVKPNITGQEIAEAVQDAFNSFRDETQSTLTHGDIEQ